MNRCKLFFSMALSGMVLFSSALAQSYGDGTVLTGQDEPVKQARVEISHQDGADSQTVYTDDEGAFSFNNLYTGTSDGGRLEGITVAGSPGRMHTVVYPTPGEDDGVARLYGMNGRLVREIPVDTRDGVATASFGDDLSPGVYLYNDGNHTAKVVHTSNGPRASQSMPSFKSSSERDMYTFTITPQDGESNVLFDETVSDQNLESGYNTVDLTVVPTAFMHSVSGEGNVGGAELVFENEGEQIFQTTTDGDGTYQTGSDYLNNRTEDFNITITPPSDDYESLDTLITRNWNEGEGSTFDFNLD
ncbi:MAG: carboxypeptidase-like regulatory domain-containing protein, partial [Bacteroidales bacterium]|nr:carboxypeptidase-like regulatory domain-containing protein [Bacteroidales bacterium]